MKKDLLSKFQYQNILFRKSRHLREDDELAGNRLVFYRLHGAVTEDTMLVLIFLVIYRALL